MFATLEYQLTCAMESMDLRHTEENKALAVRVAVLETRLAALQVLVPADVLAVAEAAKRLGLEYESLLRKRGRAVAPSQVNALFRHLKQRGWSVDRIARATGYSSRGVAANLNRFSASTS